MINLKFDIPEDLLNDGHSENDFYILIGENGSGKSQMLAKLAKEYLRIGKKVIAISNSIYDKFPDSGKDLHLLRDRSGRKKVKRSIKGALLNIPNEEITRFKNAAEALRFIGYDPIIGIENISIKIGDINIALDKINNYNTFIDNSISKDNNSSDNELNYESERLLSSLSRNDIEELSSLILKLRSINAGNIVWLTLTDFSFQEIDRVSLIQLLKWESVLRKLKLIDSISIYLSRNGNEIPLFDASSGELSFISTLIYLATTIDINSVILIDEPENSLHPRWQKQYLKILSDLFYLYQPKVVAATHSALVVTGAEVSIKNVGIFECKNFKFIRKSNDQINIEEVFLNYFNVITPENRFLSRTLIELLNSLAEKKISYEFLILQLNKFETESFQDKQIAVLEGVKEIALKINNITIENE